VFSTGQNRSALTWGGSAGNLADMVRVPERRSVRAFMWRSRWAIWALFAAVLVRIALPGVVGAVSGGELVVGLARDVPAGTQLAAEDLRLIRAPPAALPDGALTSLEQAVGARPRTDLPKGLVLADRLIASTSPLDDLPAGRVAVAVHLSDPGAAAMVDLGDRVDLLASPGAGASGSIAPAQRLAKSALVLGLPADSGDRASGLGSALGGAAATLDQSGLLLVAVTPDEAAMIGGASSWAVITAVMVPD
jgi:Flp pilus assembly protein CpaB